MARKSRHQRILPAQPNHAIARGNNRRTLFSYPRERRTFLRILREQVQKTDCALHAICLMTNHIHLLITPPTVEAMSFCMKITLQRHAQRRNTNRGASGKLFEQRFDSEPVTDTRQLAATQMYIEANPIRAGIARDPITLAAPTTSKPCRTLRQTTASA